MPKRRGGRRPSVELEFLVHVKALGGSASFNELLNYYKTLRSVRGEVKSAKAVKGVVGNILSRLVEKGFLERDGDGIYRITDKGDRYLRENIDQLVHVYNQLKSFETLINRFGAGPTVLVETSVLGQSFDAIFMDFIAPATNESLNATNLINMLGWNDPRSGITKVPVIVHEGDDLSSLLTTQGWNRVWYETEDSHIFDFFDPPGINTIVTIAKEREVREGFGEVLSIRYWTAIIYPVELDKLNQTSATEVPIVAFFKPYAGSEVSRLFTNYLFAYSIYYALMIDAILRSHFNSKLLLELMLVTESSKGLIHYAVYDGGYDVVNMVMDSIKVATTNTVPQEVLQKMLELKVIGQ